MSNLTSNDCIRFVNLTRSTIVDSIPWKESKGKWYIHNGKHKVHQDEYPFKFVYLNSGINLMDLSQLLVHIHPDVDKVHFIYAESNKGIIEKNDGTLKRFRKLSKFTPKEYVLSFIESEIDQYRKTIQEINVNYYIDPYIKTPSTFKHKVPNAIKQFITESDKDLLNKVGILHAEPGQGKTFLCQYVAKDTAQKKTFIPLLIQSNQWARMAVDDLKSIAKTIINALKSFGSNISWVEGNEDEFVRITLKADVFRLIFDGFDEYILKNSFMEKPEAVLGYLLDLAKNSGARIVVTTRTSFWAANIDESNFTNDILLYELCPFEKEHAISYFKKRLSSEPETKFATDIFKSLIVKNKDIAGRGFVLSLIADYSEKNKQTKVEGNKTISWLFRAFCEREQERQGLTINSDDQIELLKLLSIEIAEGSKPSDEDLQVLLSTVKSAMDSEAQKNTVYKLKSHPLIENLNGVWQFKNEQVFYNILAQTIYDHLKNKASYAVKIIKKFYIKEKSFISNVCDWITVIGIEEQNDKTTSYVDFVSDTVHLLNEFISKSEDSSPKESPIPIFLTSLIIISLENLHKTATKEVRTDFIKRVCGSSISNLSFWGTLSSFDFSDIEFVGCKFENVYWSKCKFDQNTKFIDCAIYSSTPLENCEGFHLVNYKDCKMDLDFEKKKNSILIQKGRKIYDRGDLSSDIKTLSLKFITANGIPNQTIEKINFDNKGSIIKSKFKSDITTIFIDLALEEILISGTNDGGYKVRKEFFEDFTFFYNNNTFTGVLKEIFDKLCEKIKI